MSLRHRPFVTFVLLAALIALPALDAVCLAACEPESAGVDALLSSHHVRADACHDGAGSETRVVSSANTVCGDHDRAASNADATLRPGRDVAAPQASEGRVSTVVRLAGNPSATESRLGTTLPAGPSHASRSIVLRI